MSSRTFGPAVAVALLFISCQEVAAQTRTDFVAKLHSGWKLVGSILEVGVNRNLFPNTGYGVFFNDDGKGPLHQASAICGSTYEVANRQGIQSGYCTITDIDGDEIWTTLSSAGPKDGADVVGTHQIRGGNGKYQGLQGTISVRCTIVQASHQLICTHEASANYQ